MSRKKVKSLVPKPPVLTEFQEVFVSAFVGEANLDKTEAARAVRAKMGGTQTASDFMNSKAVIKEIHKRLNQSTLWLNEKAVIEKLWKEGSTANSASARINALVWVGKHLGMWKDKVEEKEKVTYNIVNYSTPAEKMVEVIEAVPEASERAENISLPEGVTVLSYKEAE